MEVTFTRTGERRYRVTVEREQAPDLVMDPAPGYDPFLPHDLVHFVVEREWGLQHGVFGQLAEGGDAGTFRPVGAGELRRQRARGARVRAAHVPDTGASERLAHIAHVAWRIRRGRLVEAWDDEMVRDAVEVDAVTLDRAVQLLDQFAERWRGLQVGGSITLVWPWPEGHRRSTSRRTRKSRRAAVRKRARS